MVGRKEVVTNGAMALIVALHFFGGEKPLVSKTVAVAVSVIQFCALCNTLLVELQP